MYKVRITTPLGVRTYGEEILTDLKQTGDKDNSYLLDFREKAEGTLTFTGADYQMFKMIDGSDARLEEMYIKIWDGCGDEEKLILSGRLSFLEASYNDDRCKMSVKCTIDDRYVKFEQEKTTEYNLLDNNIVSVGIGLDRLSAFDLPTGVIIRNGVRLTEAIDILYKKIYPLNSLRSRFLNIGYGGIGSSALYGRLLLFQKSDVVRRNVGGYNATIMKWTLGELIENTCKQLNLFWAIDVNGDLKIDRYDQFTDVIDISDWTIGKKADEIAGLNRWRYKSEKVYRREKFINEESRNKDFKDLSIEYNNALTDTLEKDAENKINVSWITDLESLFELDPYDYDLDYDGTVLVATKPNSDLIKTDTPIIDATPKWNNVLSWAYLLPDRHVEYGRLFRNGVINGVDYIFPNTLKTKIQNDLKGTVCCEDNFNVRKLVKTGLGIGEIDKYSFDFAKKVVQIDLAFESYGGLHIVVPKAVGDTYLSTMGLAVNTELDGRPKLTANDLYFTGVMPENKKTEKGGFVEIFADGNFIYTPPSATFYGVDTFDYTITDDNGYSDVGFAKVVSRWANVYVKDIGTGYGEDFYYDPETDMDVCVRGFETSWIVWYKDSAGTEPLDVTDYGFPVRVQNGYSGSFEDVEPFGYEQNFGWKNFGCGGMDTVGGGMYDVFLALFPSLYGDYTIIP